MKYNIFVCGLTAAYLSASAAYAAPQSGSVPFSGTVASNCTVIVGSDGTLAANTDATVLSSKETLGAAGTARIITNDNSFSVSVANPADFAGPAGFTSTPSFLTEFSLGGVSTGSGNASSSPVSLSRGQTTVDVDLTATLVSPEVFAQGDYSATVTLTCG